MSDGRAKLGRRMRSRRGDGFHAARGHREAVQARAMCNPVTARRKRLIRQGEPSSMSDGRAKLGRRMRRGVGPESPRPQGQSTVLAAGRRPHDAHAQESNPKVPTTPRREKPRTKAGACGGGATRARESPLPESTDATLGAIQRPRRGLGAPGSHLLTPRSAVQSYPMLSKAVSGRSYGTCRFN